MPRVLCSFCGMQKNRAKEHMWPDWLLKHLNFHSVDLAGTHYALSGQIVSRRQQKAPSALFGKVCMECNEGWMSQLESKVIPIIKALFETPRSKAYLLQEEASVLAVWTFKTAIVRNAATKYRQIVPPDHFRHLYEHRSIPEGIYVDLAFVDSHHGLSGLQSQTLPGFVRGVDQGNAAEIQNGIYNITLAIGPLLLRVVYFQNPAYTVSIPDGLELKIARIHPSQIGGVSINLSQPYSHPHQIELDAIFHEYD